MGAVALLLGFGALWLVAQAQTERARADARVRAETFATRLADSLYAAEHTGRVLPGLRPQAIASQEVFERVTRDLKDVSKAPLVMQWAPQAVVRYSHPLAGNERAIGLDLRAEPRTRELVEAIIASGRGRWDGPFPLLQGGLGMVYRVPVYRDGAAATEENFLGLATTLVNLSVSAQTLAKEFPRHTMRVTARAGTGKALEVWGEPAAGASEAAALAQARYVPQGEASAPEAGVLLEVAATPRAPAAGAAHWPALLGVALLALLAGWLASTIESRRAERMRLAESEALRESEAKFHALFDGAPNAFLLMDSRNQGQISACNKAAERMLRGTAEQIIGKTPTDFSPLRQPDGQLSTEATQKRIREVMETGRHEFEWVHQRLDGEEFWTQVTCSILPHAERNIMIMSWRDLTEQKAAEAARDDLFAETSDLIQSIDANGRILYANRSWLETLGYTKTDLPGLNIFQIIHPDCREQCMVTFKQLMQGETPGLTNATFITKDGRTIEVEGNLNSKMVNGVMASTRGIFRNITQRKQAETALRKTVVKLSQSNTELERFAYVASHDLQEPLRAISGCVQLLERDYREKLDARAEGVDRMHRLINDLLSYSRVAQAQAALKPVDLHALLAGAQRNLEAAIAESAAVIDCDDLPTVHGDPTQLTQLFQNLLGNAIKFRGTQPPVIHVFAERQPGFWQIGVRDNGIGIDQQYFKRIFDLFQRLHTRDVYPGTGLGLSICQKIVRAHGGEIWVESTVGQGATFFFTLPDQLQGNP